MRKFARILLIMTLGLVALAARAETYVEGQHYKTLPAPIPVLDASKIEVVELFWYGCPHCYKFDPLVNAWKKSLPEDVSFFRSPAAFNKIWKAHAQAFYTAEALDVSDKMHQPLFDALARDQQSLNSEDDLAKFFAQYDVEEARFKKAYNSFSVKSKVEQAASRALSARATGVPALVVNGKYRIDAIRGGTYEDMLKVADFLIDKERQAKGS
ncbi:thiol:disulfide interchange protein DsbA/DsbL [Hahella aquimaris]|uniref:thiol:disulfide interchange protein DsbA/DsbL n=1 Tax=Hahella sp. HNIBRBA332 TaxID=3015983 RepID=UPI00273BB20C|nr:thiol:disulfide interchange protein DsbA/DsbL [Hahella sp. HNIBRBA332]WLQ12244.1 thiol:disulfide interchange protein DsbA/DsbL [Hahella sp. HNIBRBA332]